ncbi:MAG: SDR family NAD(P)-dependent oxidoreductase, partial [Myxococcota bacterium]|nr:SDR family NAD(P)-dependent oxidoreductase [Myxococcota bacterium]
MDKFKGRTAVITGAASGIGRALSARCAGLGMNVVLVDVEARALEVEVHRLEGEGHKVMAVPTDVRQADQV